MAIGTNDDVWRHAVQPGMPVRLRLINTDSATAKFRLSGMHPSVVAIDGADIAPARVPAGEPIEIGAGGRYDLCVPQARRSRIRRGRRAPTPRSCSARTEPGTRSRLRQDRVRPGARARTTPVLEGSHFDRTFQLTISKKVGFLNGRPGRHWALNGKLYPRVPMFEVAKGDLVRINLINDSSSVSSDAPARSPLPRPHAQRQGGEPLVDRHAADAPARAVLGRLPGEQPGPLDAALPQPRARGRRADACTSCTQE